MSCDWFARWCSLDEISTSTHLVFTDDGSPVGVARAHCLVETPNCTIGVSSQGSGGEHTGFWKCPSSEGLVILFENKVVVVDLGSPESNSVVDVLWVAGPPIITSRYVVLWSFWAITLIASPCDIIEKRFEDGEIQAVSLLSQPERLEIEIFFAGETVKQTLFL
ncbi:hypothetical protein [Methylocystis heyeri]|uniref:Uncharacterized protein n=1 Tax=Methylocystis heyeri TaxID=391905 RepID=A0A6B8KBV9_9HYPH|nr:hypothetical protein [Methylocystis heyeri]QGM45157.1 hypothetical protein H2LOC_005325 [Methylocystis heyeri]